MVLKYWHSYGKHLCLSMINRKINRIYFSWVYGYTKFYVKRLRHFRPLWKLLLTSPLGYTSKLFLKVYFTHCWHVAIIIIIIFNASLYKSVFFNYSFGYLVFCLFVFSVFSAFSLFWIWYYLYRLFNICLTYQMFCDFVLSL